MNMAKRKIKIAISINKYLHEDIKTFVTAYNEVAPEKTSVSEFIERGARLLMETITKDVENSKIAKEKEGGKA